MGGVMGGVMRGNEHKLLLEQVDLGPRRRPHRHRGLVLPRHDVLGEEDLAGHGAAGGPALVRVRRRC